VTGHSVFYFFDGTTLELNFSATIKDFGLKFSLIGKDLMPVKLQKRKSKNIDPRVFPSPFFKNLELVTGH
jgi:hypothetical protein